MSARAASLLSVLLVLSSLVVPAAAEVRALPVPGAVPVGANHPAIGIYGNADFTTSNGVTGGSGTAVDPYRIDGWILNASTSIALTVQNTDAYFVVRNVTVDNGPLPGLAIYFSNVHHARVEDSHFAGNITGIQVWNGFGGVPAGSDDIVIVNNTFDLSWIAALELAAYDLTVSGNVVELERNIPQGTSAILVEGRGNSIRDNRIVSAGSGLIVACSEGATVTGNVITASNMAVDVVTSSGVRVHHNDILQGSVNENAYAPGVPDCSSPSPPTGPSAWDDGYPSGGNFWTDYAGLDGCSGPLQNDCASGDGLGDTPQGVPGSAVGDRYPLMRPPYREGLAFTYMLYGGVSGSGGIGWGSTNTTLALPGPTLYAFAGSTVRLDLRTEDGVVHRWFLDANNNSIPDAGEPASATFGYGAPTTFTFTFREAGAFTYRCAIHPAVMWGTIRILRPVPWTPHAPISIQGDAGFTPGNGVVSGNGTAGNPFVIEGWDIDASYVGILLINTAAHVIIRDLRIFNETCRPDGTLCGFVGIQFSNVSHADVRSLTISGMSRSALWFGGVQDVLVANSSLSGGHIGVALAGTGYPGHVDNMDVVVQHNQVACVNATAAGISVIGFRISVVNNIVRCGQEGIYLSDASDVLVSHNAVIGAIAGIVAFSGRNVTIRNNDVVDLNYGTPSKYSPGTALLLWNITDGHVADNLFRSGGALALQLYQSSSLQVVHNSIVGDPTSAYDSFGSNLWDGGYPSGGNYWSDFGGVDRCSGPSQADCTASDGLADSPRVLDAGSGGDTYPLMAPPLLVNAFPHSALRMTPVRGNGSTLFRLNASGSSDAQDAADALVARWDWTDDGLWETPWSRSNAVDRLPAAVGNWTVRVAIRDLDGLVSEATATVVVDSTPPRSSLTLSGIVGAHGWYRSAVMANLTATDPDTGVAALATRVDRGSWSAYSGPLALRDGNHSLEYRATDQVGNVEPVHEQRVQVDTEAPWIWGLVPSGVLTVPSASFTWHAGDNTSGIAVVAISMDGSAFTDWPDSTYTALLADGRHTFTVRASDVAGNNVTASVTLLVDTNAFSFSGPYDGWPTLLLATVAAAGVAFSIYWYRRRKPPAGHPLLPES